MPIRLGSPKPTRRMESRANEAPSHVWDTFYLRGDVPWRSAGISEYTRSLLRSYAPGPRLLEIGCGLGDDATDLVSLGFTYLGMDMSRAAIAEADSRKQCGSRFLSVDFFGWSTKDRFDVIYEKGVLHGLAGVRRRTTFLRRVASFLMADGVWITVCGSADHRRTDFCHGAIYLRDLVWPAERYFEVLEIKKGRYGLVDVNHDFDAWHGAFRRR